MKRLKSVENDQVQLEVVECDCGFHLGLDATYLVQVDDIELHCPSCGACIDTEVICPEGATVTVKLPLIAEIEVRPSEGQDHKELARHVLDTFRESALPSQQGITLYEQTERCKRCGHRLKHDEEIHCNGCEEDMMIPRG